MPAASVEELEALRLAVAVGSQGLLIGPDNEGAGWCPIEEVPERAGRGEIVAVMVADDIVALDADSSSGPARLAMVEAGERISAALRQAGCEPVVLSSGGEGHWHLLCRVEDRDLRDRCRRSARRAGIDVRSGGARLRLPGSAHRNGGAVVLRSHRSWAAAAAALSRPQIPESGGAQRARVVIGSPRAAAAQPSARLWELIRHGDHHDRFVGRDGRCDGSRLVMSICSLAVAEGVDSDRIFELLRCDSNVGGDALRRRSRRGWRAARRWFDHTWDKATVGNRQQAVTNRAEALVELSVVEAAASRARFQGRSAGSTVAVLTAALTLARRRGGVSCPMSVRELAELAGVNVSTVRPALARLRVGGWLHLVGRSEGDRAAIYACRVPLEHQGHAGAFTPGEDASGEGRAEAAHEHFPSGGVGTVRIWRDRVGDDAFAHGALGKTGLRVLEALSCGGAQRVSDVARALGMHPGTVRRSVARLVAVGLAVRGAEGLVSAKAPEEVDETTLIQAAGDRCGRAARRMERHIEERERFTEWLVERQEAGLGRLVRWPVRPERVLRPKEEAA